MKLYLSSFCFFCFVIIETKSQNLVPNYGFETVIQCPPDQGFIYKAPPWFQPSIRYGNTSNSSSTDLYDTCSNGSTVGIPLNAIGYQPARSGYGYAGILVNYYSMNYREYVEVPLTSTLFSNHSYCVQFYVSLADTSEFAISNMGAYFSVDSLLDSTPGSNAIEYVTPQVENPLTNVLNDKVNWMLVSGTFTANGGEKYLTIGNFHTDANTNLQNVTGGTQPFSYYYIDDISVVDCSAIGINEINMFSEINVYPNPATNELNVESLKANVESIAIYNVLGCEILKQVQNGKNTTLDISFFAKGIYFVEVQTKKGIIRNKFVKE